jgi:hypothetical protein
MQATPGLDGLVEGLAVVFWFYSAFAEGCCSGLLLEVWFDSLIFLSSVHVLTEAEYLLLIN